MPFAPSVSNGILVCLLSLQGVGALSPNGSAKTQGGGGFTEPDGRHASRLCASTSSSGSVGG